MTLTAGRKVRIHAPDGSLFGLGEVRTRPLKDGTVLVRLDEPLDYRDEPRVGELLVVPGRRLRPM